MGRAFSLSANGSALDYYRKFRERQLRASQLEAQLAQAELQMYFLVFEKPVPASTAECDCYVCSIDSSLLWSLRSR